MPEMVGYHREMVALCIIKLWAVLWEKGPSGEKHDLFLLCVN